LDDVFVPQVPQDLDLLAQVLDVLLAFAVLHDEFHGCDLASAFATTLVDLVRVPKLRQGNKSAAHCSQ
jgi:hypothetical protein